MTDPTLSVAIETDGPAWDAFVGAHPSATAYHSWAWREVFGGVFGHEPLYLTARRAGRIAGVLPVVAFRSRLFGRFLCSLPFVNYGGVLVDGGELAAGPDAAHVARALVDAAADLARDRSAAHVELRHIDPQLPGAPTRTHKVTMWLPLQPDADQQWKALDNKVRNQVRKAEKSGLTACTGGAERLGEFYPVFAETMRDLGTPVYPRRFFETVLRVSGAAARLHVVRQGRRVLAAGLTIDHTGRTEVPWAASLREFRALCPNMLLYWQMLRDTVGRGSPVFDFGRSTPGEGTYHFKKQWKAAALPLHWEYALLTRDDLPDQSPTNAKFHLAVETWKRLPLAVTNRVGPLIIGNIP